MNIRNKNGHDLWTLAELLRLDPVKNSMLEAIQQSLGSEFTEKDIQKFQDGFKQSIDKIQNEAN